MHTRGLPRHAPGRRRCHAVRARPTWSRAPVLPALGHRWCSRWSRSSETSDHVGGLACHRAHRRSFSVAASDVRGAPGFRARLHRAGFRGRGCTHERRHPVHALIAGRGADSNRFTDSGELPDSAMRSRSVQPSSSRSTESAPRLGAAAMSCASCFRRLVRNAGATRPAAPTCAGTGCRSWRACPVAPLSARGSPAFRQHPWGDAARATSRPAHGRRRSGKRACARASLRTTARGNLSPCPLTRGRAVV